MRTQNTTAPSCCLVAVMVAVFCLIPVSGRAWAWSNDPTVNTPICTASDNQWLPTLISDGSGGAIITWEDYRSGTNYDIYTQRVDASGNVKWTENGVAICTASDNQYIPTLTIDGSGGAIITWEDPRSGSGYDSRIQMVRFTAVPPEVRAYFQALLKYAAKQPARRRR